MASSVWIAVIAFMLGIGVGVGLCWWEGLTRESAERVSIWIVLTVLCYIWIRYVLVGPP